MTTRTFVIPVKGMTCSACAATIEKGLRGLPGVAQASVSYTARAAHVEGDVEEPALIDAIARLGYEGLPSVASTLETLLHGADEGRPARRDAWVAAGLCALAFAPFPIDALAAAAALAGPGRRVFVQAARLLVRGQLAMDSLVALGVGAAFALAVWDAAAGRAAHFAMPVFILAFVLVGRALEEAARRRAGAALAQLGARARADARVVRDGEERLVPASTVEIGETCVVRPGEAVPVDGRLLGSASSFDESVLTGEPLPRFRAAGASVVAGSVNAGTSPVRVEATAVGAESTLARLLRLVARCQAAKPPVQALADRVSGVFVPIVVVLALLVAAFGDEPRAAVAVLVVACPCALGLATPTVVQVASGLASRLGILVRDPGAFETAARVDVLVADKTGTLTLGEPLVEGLVPLGAGAGTARGSSPAESRGTSAGAPAMEAADAALRSVPAGGGLDARSERALAAAAALEAASSHPLAAAITGEVARRGLARPGVDLLRIETAPGGARGALLDGTPVAIGSPAYVASLGIDLEGHAAALERLAGRGWTVAVAALGGEPVLAIGIADRVRPTTTRAVRVLERLGVHPVMSTGDHAAAARAIGALAGIAEIHAGESPQDKAERVRELQRQGHVVAMVGDGSNDAPALAAADVGIAVGGSTDLARASAPLVLVHGDLARCTVAIELARRTRAIIRQNLVLAFAYNVVALPAAALGHVEPPFAAAAMAASSLAVVGNALRLQRFRSRLETGFGEES